MEKIVNKLNCLDYNYKIIDKNVIEVSLNFNQKAIIQIIDNKLVVNDEFNGWNFITGRINKNMNFSLKFLSIIIILVLIYIQFTFSIDKIYHYIIILFLFLLEILWFLFYYIQFTSFKKIIINIWLNSSK